MNINNIVKNTCFSLKFTKFNLKRIISLIFLCLMVIFLFVGNGAGEQNHRLLRDLWDAGHLILFASLIFIYLNFMNRSYKFILSEFVYITIFCFIVGTAIEVIQMYLQRGFSSDDIINDVIGGYLGILLFIILNISISRMLRFSAVFSFILLLLIGLREFEKDLYDEFLMHEQFPTLADFENQLEMERWEFIRVVAERVDKYPMSAEYSLKLTFISGQYPTINMQYLKHDWSNYNTLVFSVFNPNYDSLMFEVKIADQAHDISGSKYNDRFNKNIIFNYGWNIIEIPLNDIMTAPKHRLMDMKKVSSVSLFTHNITTPVTIYLDDVHLE